MNRVAPSPSLPSFPNWLQEISSAAYKLKQVQQLEIIYIYYFIVSVVRESGHSLTVLRVYKAAVKVLARLHPHLEAQLGKNPFPNSFNLLT